jgi:hypothetical protein
MRRVAGSPIPALNEIVELTFAVAVAARLPPRLAKGVNINVDVLARWSPPQSRHSRQHFSRWVGAQYVVDREIDRIDGPQYDDGHRFPSACAIDQPT